MVDGVDLFTLWLNEDETVGPFDSRAADIGVMKRHNGISVVCQFDDVRGD